MLIKINNQIVNIVWLDSFESFTAYGKNTFTGSKPFLTVKNLKKLVDVRKINKAESRSIRFTVYEDERVAAAAREIDMEVSDFIRLRLFSDETPPVLI